MNQNLQHKINGLLLGTAVGDSLGLPMEGLKPEIIHKLGWDTQLKQRFAFGKGMWSDDTEQTIMLAQALLASQGSEKLFLKKFAWELRWWFCGLPSGTGLATARAIIRLWLGFSPHRSGVFSAGNGAAMRAAVIAAYTLNDNEQLKQFTKLHTKVTHSDPKAAISSLAIASLAQIFLTSDASPSGEDILKMLENISSDDSWTTIITSLREAYDQKLSLRSFLETLGINPEKGISGYAYHTVPAVLYSGLINQWDFKKTISEIILAGGDTDSTAAIAGALCGALHGEQNIPQDWLNQISEWPTSIHDLRKLSTALLNKQPNRIRPHWSPFLLLRNIYFLIIVLIHGFSRLLPISIRKLIFN